MTRAWRLIFAAAVGLFLGASLPRNAAAQSASSASFKVTTQAVEVGGSPTSPTANALTSASFKAVTNVGRAADNRKTTASFTVREGYIPTLQFAPAAPPAAPVVTTSPKKTNDNTPIVEGTSDPGVTIKVFEGANPLGTGTAASGGTWSVHTTVVLPDGPHTLYAKASNGAGDSPASNTVVITIDTVPPAAPAGLRVQGFDGGADLFWQPNTEADLRGYNIYRKDPGGTTFAKINGSLPVVGTQYRDTGLTNGLQYCYKITAVDDALNERHP